MKSPPIPRLKLPPPPQPLLYLITNRLAQPLPRARAEAQAERAESEERERILIDRQLRIIETAAASGCQLIQIRERDLSARALIDLSLAAIDRARPHGARVLINDRLDVALAVNADGVHLRTSSIPAREARAIAMECGRDDLLIGASVHSLSEAEEAAQAADFLVCGPVYETPSKLPFGAPIGLRMLGEIARAVRVPVLAIGGIGMENYRQALASGACGVAAIGLFADPVAAGERVRRILAEQ